MLQMERVVVVALFVVEAAGGVDALLLQAFGQLVEPFARHAPNIIEVVTQEACFALAHLFNQLHHMGGVELAGKVEVHLADARVGVAHGAPHAVDVERMALNRHVAEVGEQQEEGVEAACAEHDAHDGGQQPCQRREAPEHHNQRHEEDDEVPEHVERGAVERHALCLIG